MKEVTTVAKAMLEKTMRLMGGHCRAPGRRASDGFPAICAAPGVAQNDRILSPTSPETTGKMEIMGSDKPASETGPARAALLARLAEINEEIAHYPQPIARCDAQLGGLLEERLRLRAQLEEPPAPER